MAQFNCERVHKVAAAYAQLAPQRLIQNTSDEARSLVHVGNRRDSSGMTKSLLLKTQTVFAEGS